jgi:hypothetical protein
LHVAKEATSAQLDSQTGLTRAISTSFRERIMTDDGGHLMNQFEITDGKKTIFHFRGHKCERLDDSINYAKKGGRYTKPLGSEPI